MAPVFAALCLLSMSNLRSTSLRARDFRKLIDLKALDIQWEKGCSEKNEWVYISEKQPNRQDSFDLWLASKSVSAENQCLIIDDSFSELSRVTWKQVIENNSNQLQGKNVSVYDVDLKWLLQVTSLGVARFGRYQSSEKT